MRDLRPGFAGLTAALACLTSLAACDNRPNQWDAFVYPDKADRSHFEQTAGFKTFHLCREAAKNRVSRLADPPSADYECGHKCGKNEIIGEANRCAERRR